MPLGFVDFPIGLRERLGFASGKSQQPEARALVFLVGYMRVVFVLFLFFFDFGFRIGSQERNLLAVGRPRKILNAPLPFGESRCFTAVGAHDIDLLLLVAIREKCELFAVGRPARKDFGLGGIGKLPDVARLLFIKPDMASATLTLWRFGDHECKTRSVRRKLRVGNAAQAQRSLWSEVLGGIGLDRLLSEERFCQKDKGEESADAKAEIHQVSFKGGGKRLYLWA